MQTLATYPHWLFDNSPIEDTFGDGQRAVEFLRGLKHPKSRLPGKAFQLDEWLERLIRRTYGPRKSDGTRVVSTVYLQVGRGNRKTSIAAAIALLHLFGPEREPGAQIIATAGDQNQSDLLYEEAIGIIRAHPVLAKMADLQPYRHRAKNKANGSMLQSTASEAARMHGKTPSVAILDELHAWPKSDLYHVIKTGLAKTTGSLMIIISTAGRGQTGIAFEQVEYARKVATGAVINPAWLPVLFECDKDADWRDEALWHLMNPGLKHGYPSLSGLRDIAREAENKPGERDAFKNLHLGIWLDHSASPFIDMAIYDRGNDPIDIEALRGQPCFVGVDMSTSVDLTCVAACFRDENDVYTLIAKFFCPADNLRAREERDGVPYVRWAEEGWITATPGNVIDTRAVESYIRDLAETYELREAAFDRAYASPVMSPLNDDGFPVTVLQMGWVTQSPALNLLEAAILSGKFRHGGNPVLRWCFDNVAIQTDGPGNRTAHKGRSKDRIDGFYATWMALSRAAANDNSGSIYADVCLRPDGLLIF